MQNTNANIFSQEATPKFSDHTGITNYLIDMEKAKQSLYRPIHSLKLMELKTLKTYIKVNL